MQFFKSMVYAVLIAAGAAALIGRSEAATLDYTVSGSGSGTLNGVTFTNQPFLITLTANPATDIASFGYAPTVATISIGGGAALSFTNQVFFGETFDSRIYLSGRNSFPFVTDFFGFSLPGYVDLSAAFGSVIGTNAVVSQFVGVQTSGGALAFTSSSDVQFRAAPMVAAVPGPVAGAGIPAFLGVACFVAYRQRRRILA